MTIGYLTNDLVNNYNCAIWEGVRDASERSGIELRTFIGGEIDSPSSSQLMRNAVYRLLHPEGLDGLIVNSTSLLQFLSPERIAEFMASFAGLPVVTHGAAYADFPAVLVDNAAGVSEAVSHLIRVHGHKRIGFIAGSRNNPESIERLAAYRKVLGDFGIEADPDLVDEGNFIVSGGADALSRMLESEKKLDAVICANDDMACGAIDRAQRAGIRIPAGLAVIGFDDLPYARNLRVPLSTVRQPLYEQGRKAVEMMAAWLSGGERPETAVLPTKLVIRRSCGCMPRALADAAAAGAAPGLDREGGKRIQACREAYARFMDGTDAESALNGLEKSMHSGAPDEFDALEWQDALTVVMRDAFAELDEPYRMRAEVFLHQARILVQDVGLNLMSSSINEYEQRMIAMRDVNMDLANSFDLRELFDVMWRRLPRIGVATCYLVLYDGGILSGNGRLMFGYGESARLSLPDEGLPFKTRDFLPREALGGASPGNFMVEALYFNQEHFGYVVMRANPRQVLFNILWRQVAASLKGSLLVRELRYKEKALEALLEDQRARAADLERANKELEAFSYSVSHDLRAPLRAMDGFARILMDDYAGSLAPEPARLLGKIVENSVRMGKLIDGLLSFSRCSRQDLVIHPVSMQRLAREALGDLRQEIASSGAEIRLGDLPDCLGDATLLRQVWVNLLSNAVKFSRGAAGPVIEIGCEQGRGERVYGVSDNGVGFDMRYADKLFGGFQRLHRTDEFEGTGIGLATVQRIVKKHGGRIWAEAAVGKGASFRFTLG